MRENNLILDKSFAFSIRIVNAAVYLRTEKKEFVLAQQLMKSGTAIGANIEEAIGGQSKADFISKISISYKEARETVYWIRLLIATAFFEQSTGESLKNDAEELCKILSKILVSSKKV